MTSNDRSQTPDVFFLLRHVLQVERRERGRASPLRSFEDIRERDGAVQIPASRHGTKVMRSSLTQSCLLGSNVVIGQFDGLLDP